jgi:hypothetical protein
VDVKKGVARANSGCLIAALTYLPLLLTWAFSLVDILARRDLSLRGKAGWLFAVVFLPPFGLAAYVARRPSPEGRARPSRELAVLMRLKNEGRISSDEFLQMKRRLGEPG